MRHNSSTSTAQTVISSFLADKSNPALLPKETTELLSPTQSNLLFTTLAHYVPIPLPRAEDTLPQGYHIVYFPTAAVPESKLAADGTETLYNPGPPFIRRMWAGGRIQWPKNVDLKFGEAIRERMELDKIEAKERRGGGEMIVMSIRKRLFTPQGEEAVNETRQWVFLKDGDASASAAAAAAEAKKTPPGTANEMTMEGEPRLRVRLTSAALFRFSALIFNSHAIHLNKAHCLKEGYPDLVVHGPLTLSLLLEATRGKYPGRWKQVTYRAVRPAYVGEALDLKVGPLMDGKVVAWAEKEDGAMVMKVELEYWE